MRRFITWVVDAQSGHLEQFKAHQTPEVIADDIARQLTSPTFLTGGPRFASGLWMLSDRKDTRAEGAYFALGVQPLPEGVRSPDELPDDDPEQMRYMQAAGSNRAMTIEARVPDADGGYTHYVLAREPGADPNRWVPLAWDNGSAKPYKIRLHPEEVFTGEQAASVFRDYIVNDQLPGPELLRPIDV
ncbi:Hypothetical protein PROPJV5_1636 [Propionibacterium ruminifibrarum]|uniref:NTP pyrophosphohydrolase n=1 Tax=Propionibacterium ruminifibrarum TaxID=1962131 RepID=A0A375I1H3_9ACTN|nr:NTP pyrophosphohydrolase [Propionibacterium ruminifibrarum]SPF68654.1 Hypothetical protein PROPJV5_1636 [Propionibacterium ruminifibrarum]